MADLPARRQSGVQAAGLHSNGVCEKHIFGRWSQRFTMRQRRVYPLLLQPLQCSVAQRVPWAGVHEAAVSQALDGGHWGRLERLSSAGESVRGAGRYQRDSGGLRRGHVVGLRLGGEGGECFDSLGWHHRVQAHAVRGVWLMFGVLRVSNGLPGGAGAHGADAAGCGVRVKALTAAFKLRTSATSSTPTYIASTRWGATVSC